jgi:hypothetical protein
MSAPVRLAGFVAVLLLVLAGSWAVGSAVGPVGPAAAPAGHDAGGGGHASDGHSGDDAQPVGVTGLAVSDGSYALRPENTQLNTGTQQLRFRVEQRDGRPLLSYDLTHERELHLVVVRRDLTRFQHLHPVRAADGTWSVPLRLDAPGPYRLFADFAPAGEPARALGVDVTVAGDYRPDRPLRGESRVSRGGGYEVTAVGSLRAGTESTLRFDVRRGGVAVTDLDPYLGALGHLVVLREGDLAYLHVHPEEGGLAFATTVPSSGVYAAFLDTSHRGKVRTAAFRLEATR